ncbi:MAG: hypothetical protein NW224_07770 [Leptolyngbyaceae cyanobacterium bins.302]|nr:hypothetical protein [Leptolyngbyaceae cyanobacterium bins.302]
MNSLGLDDTNTLRTKVAIAASATKTLDEKSVTRPDGENCAVCEFFGIFMSSDLHSSHG